MLFLTIPVFYPVIADAGIDPVWFGIFAVIVVEFGLISPPVGMNLFVIKGVMNKTPLQTIWFGTLPFLITDVIRLALLIAFPALCLYLPSLMYLRLPNTNHYTTIFRIISLFQNKFIVSGSSIFSIC